MTKSVGLILSVLFFISSAVFADQYSCAKMVYKEGWLRKYQYKGETWGAGIKKSGLMSSLSGSTTESVTSSVDPGVSSGSGMSSTQYSSSWGECSMLDYNIVKNFRENYIEQNSDEIKKQIALGHGLHVDSLAYLSGCQNIERANWEQVLQKHTPEIYDAKSATEFSGILDRIIQNNGELNSNCHLPSAS